MFKRFLLFIFFISAVLSTSLLAQECSDDSLSNTDDEEEWSDNHDFYFHNFDFKGKPTIEATYGVSAIGIKSLSRNLANAGAAELKLSYSTLKEYEGYVASYKNRFAFVSNSSMDLTSKKTTNIKDLTSETWRFGFGWQSAYAYKFGRSAIIPYTSNAFGWTRLSYTDNSRTPAEAEGGIIDAIPTATFPDAERLNAFNETFRFGTMTEGGIKIQFVPVLTLNAGYERAIVFPRHLVWKHIGSMIIEGAGQGALDMFVKEVIDSSPSAGPVVNFVLKNGLSYAVYQLRKEKMNWPFNTAAPLTFDTWKIGMTFTF